MTTTTTRPARGERSLGCRFFAFIGLVVLAGIGSLQWSSTARLGRVLQLNPDEEVLMDRRESSDNSTLEEDRVEALIGSLLLNSNNEASKSGFSKAVDIAQSAILAELENPPVVPQPFDVTMWPHKVNGGLIDEDRVAIARIYSQADSLFEFGLGESTLIANHVGVRRYAGVDSDPRWVDKTRSQVSPHYRFYLADVGATRAWGYPLNPNLAKIQMHYQLAPLALEAKPFDVYMIDGRWRVACLLSSMLHASDRGGRGETTKFLVHDCLRGSYHVADSLLSLQAIDGTRRLCVYTRKSNTTDDQVLELWRQQYKKAFRRT